MSQIIDLRRRNLALLIEKKFSGLQKNFAISTGISLSQLGQWMSPGEGNNARNMSERSARRIEVRLGLPAGWLDMDHETQRSPAAAMAVGEAWPFTTPPSTIAQLPIADKQLLDAIIALVAGRMR